VASYLEEELALNPSVALVLSSTWCIRPGYSKTLQRLSEQLRAIHWRHVPQARPWDRSMEPGVVPQYPARYAAPADVQRRKPRHWIALDDDIKDWPPLAIGNLVACNGTTGLSNPEVRGELRRKLMQSAAP